MADQQPYSIILSGGAPAQVGPPMSQIFGIDEKLASQIAGASPIVLVEGLNEDQASGVRAALDGLVSAGAEITLKAGNVGSIPKVGWGGVPKISGKPATDYTAPQAAAPGIVSAPGTLCCPACGASFKLVPEGQGAAAPAAAASAPAEPAAPMGVKDSGFEEIPLPDALKSLEAPPDLPDVPEVPSSAPAAAAAAPKEAAPSPVGGAIPASQVKPGHSAPMALEDFEAGLASDDNLLADLDDGLPDVPDEPAKPVPTKAPKQDPLVNVSGLDEIEVEPLNPPATAKAAPAKAAPAKAAPTKAAPAKAAPAKAAPAKAKAAAAPEGAGGDPNEKVNIFANKSNNPKMIDLLSKIRGVSPEEAEDLAQKPLVTIARNISRKQAEVIKKKFNESRISVRLSPARPSQRLKAQDGD
jgi:ribosomal protein L7/L12